MKILHAFYIILLLFAISAKSQSRQEDIESLNKSLKTYRLQFDGNDIFYQLRTEEPGRNIVLEMHFGGEIISNTTFSVDAIMQIETSVAPSGLPVININSQKGKMKFYSIGEKKETFSSQQNIPLQASIEEAEKIKDLLKTILE